MVLNHFLKNKQSCNPLKTVMGLLERDINEGSLNVSDCVREDAVSKPYSDKTCREALFPVVRNNQHELVCKSIARQVRGRRKHLKALGLKVQSADEDASQRRVRVENVLMHHVLKGLSHITHDELHQWFVKQVENVGIIYNMASKCETIRDYQVLTQVACRLFTGKVFTIVLTQQLEKLFTSEVQSDSVGDTLASLRQIFDMCTGVSESQLSKKLISTYSYLLTQGFLERFGLTITDEDYSRMEQRALYTNFSSKKSFYIHIIDTTLFVCERIHEFSLSGDFSSFLQDSSSHSKWMKEAQRILNLAPFTGNLKPHNTSYFSFLADLRNAIEQGEAILKFTRGSTGVESKVIRRLLASLEFLQNTEITKKAASQQRANPFGILIFGESSVAKTAFCTTIFNYFGGLHGLERGDEFRYVRAPNEEYYTNFNSSQWCVQIDDASFMKPQKVQGIDPTIGDILNLCNGVQFNPPQAALEDKGKTPVLSDLVIVNTNRADLHAHEYFSCPLAVRRRLPFVVKVVPKNGFKHANGVFIDPKKIETKEGQFPDLWDIVVYGIIPEQRDDYMSAKFDEGVKFNDINEFLKYFGKQTVIHRENQKKSRAKDKDMVNIQVCTSCLAPGHLRTDCPEYTVQADDAMPVLEEEVPTSDGNTTWQPMIPEGPPVESESFADWWFGWWFEVAIKWSFFWTVTWWFAQFRFGRYIFARMFNWTKSPFAHAKYFGGLCQNMATANQRNILFGLSLMTAGVAMYQLMYSEKESTAKHLNVQGNVFGTTETQLKREEHQNVWYNDRVELTQFDVPKASTSVVGKTDLEVRDMFCRNTVILRVRSAKLNNIRTVRGVMLKGHMCVTNGHAFRCDEDDFEVTLITMAQEPCSTNVTFRVQKRDVSFSTDKDLCAFEVESLPPFKDISKFWADSPVQPSSCFELIRDMDGNVDLNMVYGLRFAGSIDVSSLGLTVDIHMGTSRRVTEDGLCGSLCVSNTPRGPIIFGLHLLGKDREVGIMPVFLSEIQTLLSHNSFSKRPCIQSGDMPVMATPTATKTLGPLHQKSYVRYEENCNLIVRGSFSGFRPRAKSKVMRTPLCDDFLNHYKTEVKYGAPVMSGYRPWRANFEKMVHPKPNYEKYILRECVNAYLDDIVDGLPFGWEGELVMLSDKAAVNGLPGVTYIDGLNRNTSMGFPWSCTKKKYLEPSPCEDYPDGVNFTKEVWDRVRLIEQAYLSGKRANVIFTGHLKDEATPLKKVAIGKTRLFVGAPVDWSIVVRKYLLSFVRLVQKNKFVFEAGPGTVCQSAEWGNIREFLTFFGEDQMVAGDYESYDKSMLAAWILAAFEMIICLHERAGHDEGFLRVIAGIGEDIAYNIVNFDGDLYEFLCSNPSGHPLTVIINSLVNSLYLRYCFYKLNPQNECVTFRQFVRLFTYGDDNTFGVSKSAPWFNHTTIKAELARINVGYTMADKTAASVPYIHINDVSFLKRRWVWDDDVQGWLAPLEEESIVKSLTVWVPSGSIDKFKQMEQVISAANNEYFFYGRAKFEEKHQFFKELLEQEPYCFYVTESTLPSFDQLAERFHKASARFVLLTDDTYDWVKPPDCL